MFGGLPCGQNSIFSFQWLMFKLEAIISNVAFQDMYNLPTWRAQCNTVFLYLCFLYVGFYVMACCFFVIQTLWCLIVCIFILFFRMASVVHLHMLAKVVQKRYVLEYISRINNLDKLIYWVWQNDHSGFELEYKKATYLF